MIESFNQISKTKVIKEIKMNTKEDSTEVVLRKNSI